MITSAGSEVLDVLDGAVMYGATEVALERAGRSRIHLDGEHRLVTEVALLETLGEAARAREEIQCTDLPGAARASFGSAAAGLPVWGGHTGSYGERMFALGGDTPEVADGAAAAPTMQLAVCDRYELTSDGVARCHRVST